MLIKTIHHISPKIRDVFSFNCPSCGSGHMEQDPEYSHYWTCINGHILYADLYQSTAKTLNLCFITAPDTSGAKHD